MNASSTDKEIAEIVLVAGTTDFRSRSLSFSLFFSLRHYHHHLICLMKLQLQSQTETTPPETQKFLPTAITNHHRHYQASTEVLPARSWPFISRMVKASTAKTLASSSSGDVRQGSFWKPGARTSHSQCSQS